MVQEKNKSNIFRNEKLHGNQLVFSYEDSIEDPNVPQGIGTMIFNKNKTIYLEMKSINPWDRLGLHKTIFKKTSKDKNIGSF